MAAVARARPLLALAAAALLVAGVASTSDGGAAVARGIAVLAGLVAAAACAAAARRTDAAGERSAVSRGWWLLAAAAGAWSAAGGLVAAYELASYTPPAPSAVDAAAIGALFLTVACLLAFLAPALSSAARGRTVADALMVACSLLLLAWRGGLDRRVESLSNAGEMVLLAYPVTQLVILALVVVGASRSDRGARLRWGLLGSGMVLLTLGHAAFAWLGSFGASIPMGSDLIRATGLVLLALAAAMPHPSSVTVVPETRPARGLAILLPHAPLLVAVAVAVSRQVEGTLDPFSLGVAGVLVLLLIVRQVLAQFETLAVTRHLDSLVQQRTEALHRRERQFSSLVRNATDVLSVLDEHGRVRYQSASVERVLGFRPEHLQGRELTDIVHPTERGTFVQHLAMATPGGEPVKVQVHMVHREGRWRLTETSIANLMADPDVAGLLLTTRDVSDRAALEEQLRHRALHDPLTGLGNRTLFHDRLQHAAALAERDPNALAVLAIDLDGFKAVNDSLGHEAGDSLLREVADRLRACIRPGDTVARMGGDEFAVLLQHGAEDGAVLVAERILARLKAPVDLGGKPIVVSASIGVATGIAARFGSEQLLRAADLAMYSAKTLGKNRYDVFRESMQDAALLRVELESDLRAAIRKGELVLHYQPIVELPSGRLTGVEALVRWNHPTKGMVPPGDFIAVAEESELIVDLGRWVLGQACRDAARWQRPGEAPFTVAVNVSTRQLTSPWLVEEIRRALSASDVDPGALVIEITEGAFMDRRLPVQPTLDAIRDMGVQMAIDDFGTGWSSLARLRGLPVSKLKIDRAFVAEIDDPADKAPLVAAILGMAHSLGLRVVAEGVENVTQLACLHALGCDEVQGYLLARPMPADALTELLEEPAGLLGGPSLMPVGAAPLADPLDSYGLMDAVAEAATAGGGAGAGDPAVIQLLLGELCGAGGLDAAWLRRLDSTEVLASHGDLDGPWSDVVEVPVTAADGQRWGVLAAGSGTAVASSSRVLAELFAMILSEHLQTASEPAEAALTG